MTEKSYFWGVPSIGDFDASLSDDELSTILGIMYTYDRTLCHVQMSKASGGFQNSLNPYVYSGDFWIDQGVALVDGRIYENDAPLNLTPASGNGYYAIVLRKTEASQTVRAALLYNAVAAPTPTQTAATWEVVVAQGQVVAGTPQIDSDERYTIDIDGLIFPGRQGARAVQVQNEPGGGVGDVRVTIVPSRERDWTYIDPNDPGYYPSVHSAGFQCGSVAHTPIAGILNISVDFPLPFKNGHTPLVFVTPINLAGGTPSHTIEIFVHSISYLGFSIYTDLDTNINGFYWVAVGEEAEIG